MVDDIISIRVAKLFDKDSFKRSAPGENNGYVTGSGTINGRDIMASFIDPVNSPEKPLKGLDEHLSIMEDALKKRTPFIIIMDTPAQHQAPDRSPFPKEPIKVLVDRRGVGRWFSLHSRLSGKIPQIAIVLSRLGAAMTFPVALCDAAVMTKKAGMSVGRPDVVEKMFGKKVDYNELGGPDMHYRISGSVDHVAKDEDSAFKWTRDYMDYMPGSLKTDRSAPEYDDSMLKGIIPDNPNIAFNTREVIKGIVDSGSFFELRKGFATEIITGFCRVEGMTAGIIANNSLVRGGLFFPETCTKSARFISICSAFNIPMVFLADTAGFMVGLEVEKDGIISKGALLFSTIANSETPRISIVLRRNYTAGVYAMAGPGFDPSGFIALPGAKISIYGKTVAERLSKRETSEDEKEAISEMVNAFDSPQMLLEMGLIDEIVEIGGLRSRIAGFLRSVSSKKKVNGAPVLLV
ncbi:carboxyl transferase domain-containing protein [Syntrophorhabdus aromaticivorans]|uniref:carboxyl transferase domain-containing protein n=1 Tax=Syntrophorhabdus aromaticivorans TaxID=328301 RepID=UPI0004221EEE|nr:carboxyl transferase domain-containing protein [Syntrophorhabdus aromaticivorans]